MLGEISVVIGSLGVGEGHQDHVPAFFDGLLFDVNLQVVVAYSVREDS